MFTSAQCNYIFSLSTPVLVIKLFYLVFFFSVINTSRTNNVLIIHGSRGLGVIYCRCYAACTTQRCCSTTSIGAVFIFGLLFHECSVKKTEPAIITLYAGWSAARGGRETSKGRFYFSPPERNLCVRGRVYAMPRLEVLSARCLRLAIY